MKVYEIITNAILEKLEQGSVPWHRPWNGREEMPKNLLTKKAYQGINAFLLGCQGYGSPFWLTFKQSKDLGGSVRKGAKATPIMLLRCFSDILNGDGKIINLTSLQFIVPFHIPNYNPGTLIEPSVFHGRIQCPLGLFQGRIQCPLRLSIAFFDGASDALSLSKQLLGLCGCFLGTTIHQTDLKDGGTCVKERS
jgi:hypothetical protein